MINKDYWLNRNVFVTGCTGFLGSYLVRELLQRGANITGLVRDFVTDSKLFADGNDKRINVVRGSIEDLQLLERVLGEYEIETVFHIAAQAIVGIANRNPISTFKANIEGTWNVMEACRRSPTIKQVIVASSDKAYGDQERLPYDEKMPLQGKHPYDVSKSCTDLLAQAYYQTYNLPVCITRCGNLYGGGDLNFNRIIPQTIQSIIHGKAPEIRSDGTFIRDYFYVEDAVLAYLLLAEKMEEGNIYGEAFNFSNEIQLTVLELVNRILALMDSNLQPVILNQGQHEIKHQYLSAAKARNLLNWEPKYSMEEGLRKTIEWYMDFFQN
ncbi:GDP-mannose 4,6-dehydratase [Geosporobacter ferrireducens]|uniref:Sugar dehydratase n=1 Tax=Geosporobacter ferrireducens TaxID=1424294 RepID=A0A1D8GPG6_9FIRM|nr:GDP-mannose 4,6-dehydratase [Geosporobacter ferrireducens]AOT72850.1 sugar dehydratase [Geosporobacter ferrireducens]MTI55251.1 NAD-dependent epimerase/dehydratase family protein [Geosporobacter ferrireducens]